VRRLALFALAAAAAAGDAKEEAWFAFRAGEQGEKEAVPKLVEALKDGDPRARRWVLDALTRLEGEVPAEGVRGSSRTSRRRR
jgi:HEAT repeat protein